jgi:ribonucleoside-diphosphate reductase beta chain
VDEEIHVDLFVKIFKEILAENPEYNTPELEKFVQDTFVRAAELETNWGRYIIGHKIDGIDMNDLADYIKFIANKRVNQLGFTRPFDGFRQNPMRWIKAYEDVDFGKTDFFEQKSRQYTKTTSDNGFDDL